MSLALKVLVALVAGFALGLWIAAGGSGASLSGVLPLLEPVGRLWVGAIRMTIIPLVVASLILGVGKAQDLRMLGRVGGKAVASFFGLLITTAILSLLLAPLLVARVQIDPSAAEALRASAATAAGSALDSAKSIPSWSQWIVDLVPVNPVKAAADGAMLPLIVFSLAFGAALARVTEPGRGAVLDFCTGIQQASLYLVRGVLWVAPVGVFALSAVLAAKLGSAAAGAVVSYIVLVVGMTITLCLVVLYPAAVIFGRVPLGAFARAALPPQVVAFSSRSSLAALPAMLESSRARLGMSAERAGFLMPLAVTMFRAGAATGQITGAIFAAKLYGVELGIAQLAAIGVAAVVTNVSIPGIPGGSILMMVPVLLSAGIPADAVGVLLAVDTIPDMFRTATNVTGDMTVAAMLRDGDLPASS